MGDTVEKSKVLEALLLKQKSDNGDGTKAKSLKLVRFPYRIMKGAARRFSREMTATMEPPAEFSFFLIWPAWAIHYLEKSGLGAS